MKRTLFVILCCLSISSVVLGQDEYERYNRSKFKQLKEELPTPNVFRASDGSPGHEYWQQRADYDIEVELNDEKQTITGTELITYTNNSPNPLTYLWLQLEQNMRAQNSDTYSTATSRIAGSKNMSERNVQRILGHQYDLGFKISSVTTADGKPLPYTINKTMMRVDLPKALESGKSYRFRVAWSYNINDRDAVGGRGGMNYFSEDDNFVYSITQWFPRMAVYDDVNGWQHKQFLGNGEFALPFGDYKVKMTVPADHLVGSTGTLQNPKAVLTEKQRNLLEKAKTADSPVIIVSQKEAEENEKSRSKDKKTWIFHAKDVRDFAWTSSRKFIWDAMGVEIGGKTIMAMSYYPKEANPLWEKYSTEVVAHTLKVYSEYTIDYPYPVAISVEASNGMEYPMICFNYGRPDKDGTYTERTKLGMIGVIIHEIGHNFFPMIVNSDERQWTWMDEGLNTFVQYLTEQAWERNYPSRRGPAHKIAAYMAGNKDKIAPIMTNSESIHQFGNNAYGKPAAALNILRETIMGRELFDHAFKEYARRWAFKHPTPADFFRTMEDASGVDLDWFWRGWFFTNNHVDISIENVNNFSFDSGNPEVEKAKRKAQRDARKPYISDLRNKTDIPKTKVEEKPELADFYTTYDELDVTDRDRQAYQIYKEGLTEDAKKLIGSGKNFYEITFKNIGGLVMPIILEMEYEDNTTDVKRIPAEIWRYNDKEVTKVFATDKKVKQFTLDPFRETADTDEENNYYPRKRLPSRFQLYQQKQRSRGQSTGQNPMRDAQKK